MATYNGEKFIKEQLMSILSQLSDEDELIISDDSSSDNTLNIIKSLNNDRIILLKDQTFYNPIFNIENALKNARGDYIFLSDQDDIWFPNKIVETMELLMLHDCVVSDAVVVNEDFKVLHNSFFEVNRSKCGFIHNIIKNGYLGCCMAFTKKILFHALPFPIDIPMHDTWIGLISELYGKPYFYQKPLRQC